MAQMEERRRALFAATQHSRPPGAVRGAEDEGEPPEREDREAKAKDAASRDSQGKMLATPDQQISLTDPIHARWRPAASVYGVVGYNVQVAVETEPGVVTHEVLN